MNPAGACRSADGRPAGFVGVAMRRSGTIIAAASAALASGLAQAADLEVVKAEPTIYVPNNFLWGGVYVGGFVGGGWGTADWGPRLVPITVTFTPTRLPRRYLSLLRT